MNTKLLKLLAVLILAIPADAWGDVPLSESFDFSGTLLDSSSNPITTATGVDFKILAPNGTCVLYEETQTVTPTTTGDFSVQVGSAQGSAVRTGLDTNLAMATIFQNNNMFTTSTGCPSGYTPAAGDGRKLRVTVAGTALTPDFPIGAVPAAKVAETIQGLTTTQLLQPGGATAPNLTQANLNALFSGSAYTNLQALESGSLSAGSTPTTGNGTQVANLSADPGGAAAGEVWYNNMNQSLNFSSGGMNQELLTANSAINISTSASLTATAGISTGGLLSGSTVQATNSLIVMGNVGVGTTTPVASLDMSQRTDGIILPQSSVNPSGFPGEIRFNSASNSFQGYANSQWQNMSFNYNGRYGFGTTAPNSLMEITSGGLNQNPSLTYGSTFSVDAVPFNDAQTASSGTSPGTAFATIYPSTISSLNTNVTTTNADTLLIGGAPRPGSNQMLVNTSAIYVASTSVAGSPTPTNAYGLYVNAPTGAGTNNAAVFTGGNVGIGTALPAATLDVWGHIGSSNVATPSVGTCSGVTSVAGNDVRGSFTFTTTGSTSCMINFIQPYATVPICVVSWGGTTPPSISSISSSPTASQLRVYFQSAPSSGAVVNYICMQ